MQKLELIDFDILIDGIRNIRNKSKDPYIKKRSYSLLVTLMREKKNLLYSDSDITVRELVYA